LWAYSMGTECNNTHQKHTIHKQKLPSPCSCSFQRWAWDGGCTGGVGFMSCLCCKINVGSTYHSANNFVAWWASIICSLTKNGNFLAN
jgi:hypothetical protein